MPRTVVHADRLRVRTRRSLSFATQLCGVILSIGVVVEASAANCLQSSPSPAALSFFVEAYAQKRDERSKLAATVSAMLKEQLVMDPVRRADVEKYIDSLVTVLLPSASSAEALVSSIEKNLASMCEALGQGSVSTAAVADAPREAPLPPPNATAGPSEVVREQTVDATLRQLAAEAEQAIRGDKLDLFELTAVHREFLECTRNSGSPSQPVQQCGNHAEVLRDICNGSQDTARCSRRIFAEIDRRTQAIGKLLDSAATLDVNSAEARKISSFRVTAEDLRKDALTDETVRGPAYGLYAGPSFVLEDSGGWREGLEALLALSTGVFVDNCPGWPLQAKYCRGTLDISFLTPDSFPDEADADNQLPVVVFDSKGEFRIRSAFQLHLSNWVGLEAGLGVTSPISDSQTSVRAEPRAHLGLRFQTIYTDLAIGEFFAGYARDQSWERLVDADGDRTTTDDQTLQRRFDRLTFNATLIFPQATFGGLSLAARIGADAPLSGNTQSELRASILLLYPFGEWLQRFRPTVRVADNAAQ